MTLYTRLPPNTLTQAMPAQQSRAAARMIAVYGSLVPYRRDLGPRHRASISLRIVVS
jgi:hypothetical protein